jgi:hypothetical protein
VLTVVTKTQQNPEKRIAQHKLAEEATELVHGRKFGWPLSPRGTQHGINTTIAIDRLVESVEKAKTATKVLFGGDMREIGAENIIKAFAHDSSRMRSIQRDQILNNGLDAVALLAGATRSKCKLLSINIPSSVLWDSCYLTLNLVSISRDTKVD